MGKEALIRIKSKNMLLWSLFALHGLGWWGIYQFLASFLESEKQIMYAGIGVFVVFLITCVLRWQEILFPIVYTTKWYLMVEMFALYLYGLYQKDTNLRMDVLFVGMLCIIGHFWCVYLQGLNEYLEQGKEMEHTSSRQTFEINTQVVALILAVLFVCLILAELFQSDQFLTGMGDMIGRAALAVIRFVLGIIHFFQRIFSGQGTSDAIEDEVIPPLQEPLLEDHDNGLAYILGMSVFSIVLIAVFVVMIRKAQIKPEQEAGHRPDFHYHGSGEDEIENLEEEKLPFLPFFRNNREKIRYRFKKRVKGYYKKKVPEGHTAWELSRDIRPERKEKEEAFVDRVEDEGESEDVLTRLTQLYEIARYSQRIITDQEIRGIK